MSTTGTEVQLTELYSYSGSGTHLAGLTPYALLFAAKGGDGNLHLYSAQLANAAAPPTPKQISSFSVPGTDTICQVSNTGYANIADPTSAYLIVSVFTAAEITADSLACSDGNTSGVSYLVHVSDSTSTAPVQLTNVQAEADIIETFTNTGTIAGLLAFDNSSNLNYYPPVGGLPSFASPKLIASNVQDTQGYTTVAYNRSGAVLAGGSPDVHCADAQFERRHAVLAHPVQRQRNRCLPAMLRRCTTMPSMTTTTTMSW